MGGSSTDAQLLRLAQRLAAARDAPEVATIVARDVATLVGASAASIGLVDAPAGVLRVHHGPDVGPEMLERYANPPLDAPLLFTDVARTGVASCLPDFEAYRARYPDTDRANEQLGVGARAAVPLRDRGGVAFGAVVFAWEHPVDFDGSVGAALATIGDLVSQTLDRARLADAEHQLVDTFRRRLLSPIPATTGIASAGAYRPAAAEIGMGGDWYEGIALPGGRLAVVVGDVAGHGIEAVADMAHLRSILAAFLRIGLPLPRLVRRVTQAIGDAALTASLFVAVVDPTHRTIEYLLVGHPPPVLLLADTARLVAEPLHPLLGAPVGVEVGTGTIAFPVGATLLAYTDGLVERRGESLQVGLDELVRIASRFTAEPDLRTFLSRVLDALLGDTPPDDDVALVALRSIDAPPAAVA